MATNADMSLKEFAKEMLVEVRKGPGVVNKTEGNHG